VSQTVDTNVLLFASDADSPRRDGALDLLARLAEGPALLYLFWPVVVGFLRISTHPSIYRSPLTLDEAITGVADLIARPNVRCPGEGRSFWSTLRAVIDDARPRGNLYTDAHLVALMRENGVRTIWTHDRDFRRFRGIDVRDPFPA
jgi:toxin-antitoxin system PIN domain toxin